MGQQTGRKQRGGEREGFLELLRQTALSRRGSEPAITRILVEPVFLFHMRQQNKMINCFWTNSRARVAKHRPGGVNTFKKPERDAQVRIQPWWDVNKAVVNGGGAHAGVYSTLMSQLM